AGCALSASISACASSRGFFFSGFASCIAAVQARSPCAACLGDSNAGVRPASGLTPATAARNRSSSSCLAWIMMHRFRVRPATISPGTPDPSTATALPAQIGKYRVLKKLGEGATSEVFLARDEFHGRDVAIKRVRASAADAPEGHYHARFFAAEAAL